MSDTFRFCVSMLVVINIIKFDKQNINMVAFHIYFEQYIYIYT